MQINAGICIGAADVFNVRVGNGYDRSAEDVPNSAMSGEFVPCCQFAQHDPKGKRLLANKTKNASLRGGRSPAAAIPEGFRNPSEIATPVCGLVRNDTLLII